MRQGHRRGHRRQRPPTALLPQVSFLSSSIFLFGILLTLGGFPLPSSLVTRSCSESLQTTCTVQQPSHPCSSSSRSLLSPLQVTAVSTDESSQPTPMDIAFVLPVSDTLREYYLTLIDRVNAVCRHAAMHDYDDLQQVLLLNASETGTTEPMYVPGSCKRYRLVPVDFADSPEYFVQSQRPVTWPERAIVSVRSGIQDASGAADSLADMRTFLAGTLDDHPSMIYSYRPFSAARVTEAPLEARRLIGVAVRSSNLVMLFRLDKTLPSNLTSVMPAAGANALGLLEGSNLLAPAGGPLFGYIPYGGKTLDANAQLYDSVEFTDRTSTTQLLNTYASSVAKFVSSSSARNFITAISAPGKYPPYWPSLSAREALRAFCSGASLYIVTRLADLWDLGSVSCPPFGMRQEPWSLYQAHNTHGLGVTKALAADPGAALFVRAVINAAVRVDFGRFVQAKLPDIMLSVHTEMHSGGGRRRLMGSTNSRNVAFLNCDLKGLKEHFRPLVAKYWGGGMHPPVGAPLHAQLSLEQYAARNITTREEGIEAIVDNLALHAYEATCQWECHYDTSRPPGSPPEFNYPCLAEDPPDRCMSAAAGAVFKDAVFSRLPRGLPLPTVEQTSSEILALSTAASCFSAAEVSDGLSVLSTLMVAGCVSFAFFLLALFARFSLVTKRLESLKRLGALGNFDEGPIPDLWALLLRLEEQGVFSDEDKVILRVFRSRVLTGSLFVPTLENASVLPCGQLWFKFMGASNLDYARVASCPSDASGLVARGSRHLVNGKVTPLTGGVGKPSHKRAAALGTPISASRGSMVGSDHNASRNSLNMNASSCSSLIIGTGMIHPDAQGTAAKFLAVQVLGDAAMAVSPPISHPGLGQFRSNMMKWDGVDVFEVAETVGADSVLPVLLCIAAADLRIFDRIAVDVDTLQMFGDAVSSHYLDENPYHNALHGADVLHSLASQLASENVNVTTTSLEKFAALIAAAVHDVGHTGQGNSYHVTAGTDLALMYSDKSALENYHLALAFLLMRHPARDILADLPDRSKVSFRQLVVDMVLATDLGQSFDLVGKFRIQAISTTTQRATLTNTPSLRSAMKSMKNVLTPLASGTKSTTDSNALHWVKASQAGLSLMLQMCLKVCDIGHAGKEWTRHARWSYLVSEEFFLQGDLERSMGLPVSQFCDRATVNVPKSQGGFFAFFVLPSFEAWCEFTGDRTMVNRANFNKAEWEKVAKESILVSSVAPIGHVGAESLLPRGSTQQSQAARPRTGVHHHGDLGVMLVKSNLVDHAVDPSLRSSASAGTVPVSSAEVPCYVRSNGCSAAPRRAKRPRSQGVINCTTVLTDIAELEDEL